MKPLTLFSWGYWGWGTCTPQLVSAVDAAEEARGFDPPVFVDTRLRRTGRATGFVGDHFRDQLGPERYHWLPGLGNAGIADGGPMRLQNPADIDQLLDLAAEAAGNNRRVLFFCACEFPLSNEGGRCHRTLVAEVLLAAAKRRRVAVRVAEWPGGEPLRDAVEVSPTEFAMLRRGGRSVPLREPFDLGAMAALPWYSVVIVLARGTGDAVAVRVSAARFNTRTGDWYLPVIGEVRPADDVFAMLRESEWMHADDGYRVQIS